jgi:hypothetical protein
MAAGLTRPGYLVADTIADVHAFLKSARSKWGLAPPKDEDEEGAPVEEDTPVFPLLSLDELEALPPPTWLVHDLIADHGLSIVYGAPGGGKTFLALDMALRIAHGMEWHGVATKQAGVIYMAGEGARGLGKRVKGWRREHAMEGVDAPFLTLPVPVQLLDADERRKLLRTVEAAMARMNGNVGLVVIDTVSRSLAGQDENGQESMTLFVNACNAVQDFTGGAVLGVHHSGKDTAKGMRGSTVLLGGCDASIRLTKEDDGRVTMDVEKQKDAEQGEARLFTLKKVAWLHEGDEMTTLVPLLSSLPAAQARSLSIGDVQRVFGMIADGWAAKKPWSVLAQSKRSFRYLPERMARLFEITEEAAFGYVQGWVEEGLLEVEMCDARNRVSGLRVIRSINQT